MPDLAQYTALRRDIHAHPELAFDESRTAALVADRLAALGIEVATGIGGTGVVGTLRRGKGGRAIGLRADLDALPVQEANRFGHASTIAGRMHACGHDGHVAMLLAAASQLATEGGFDGAVHFVFQPGEESGRGALAMIGDGLFERFPVEAVFAAHNWPGLPVGHFAISPGPVMAACNTFHVRVDGKGGHAALPDLAQNPVLAAATIVTAFDDIASDVAKHEGAVLTVSTFHAGDGPHIIPDHAQLSGTVRTWSEAATALIEERMAAALAEAGAATGCRATLEFIRNCAATINHPNESETVRAALNEQFGEECVASMTPAMTAEDFAFMLEVKAGCYFWIGNGEGAARLPGHGEGPCLLHNPSYDFDDRLIRIGAEAWTAIVRRFLPPPG